MQYPVPVVPYSFPNTELPRGVVGFGPAGLSAPFPQACPVAYWIWVREHFPRVVGDVRAGTTWGAVYTMNGFCFQFFMN